MDIHHLSGTKYLEIFFKSLQKPNYVPYIFINFPYSVMEQ